MKLLWLLIAVVLLAVSPTLAQSPAKATSGEDLITVTKISWHQEVFIPALYEDPMHINQDRDELERDQKANSQLNAQRAKQGQTPIPQPNKKVAANVPVGSTPMGVPLGDEPSGNKNLPSRPDPGPSSRHYVYEAKIKNNSDKAIRTIAWIYSFQDSETGEVNAHRFLSKVDLRPGKTGDLKARSSTPPSRVVSATKSDKETQRKLNERVLIDRIEYADGSFWQRPENASQ